MNQTTIEWVRNPDGTQGFTWNPITGCLNGCEYCYARRLANTRLRHAYLANTNLPSHDEPGHEAHHSDPFWPRLWPKRLAELHQVKSWTRARTTMIARFEQKPKGIFVCDMGELFGPWLPPDWTADVLEAIEGCPQHRFYLLTKQPQELVKWSPFPENCWVGVSAWDGPSFMSACEHLKGVQATVKYISLEPLLEWDFCQNINAGVYEAGVTWVIIGAQTKPPKVPEYAAVHAIISDLQHFSRFVAVFLKESLRYAYGGPHEPFYWHDPGDPRSWNLLQEFPDGKVVVGDRAIPRENVAAEIRRLEARA